MHDANIISPFDSEGRAILYGTTGNDILYDKSDQYPFYAGLSSNGIALIGGGGSDWLVGNNGYSDILDGGEGLYWVDYSYFPFPFSGIPLSFITFNFDGTSSTPVITVQDDLGGTDTLRSIEKVIGSTGQDTFSFKGTIPNGYDLLIDGGGGEHDKIDLHESVGQGGMKVYILNPDYS